MAKTLNKNKPKAAAKKPWPKCDKCRKADAVYKRTNDGQEEHYCGKCWPDRPQRKTLPPKKSLTAKKALVKQGNAKPLKKGK